MVDPLIEATSNVSSTDGVSSGADSGSFRNVIFDWTNFEGSASASGAEETSESIMSSLGAGMKDGSSASGTRSLARTPPAVSILGH